MEVTVCAGCGEVPRPGVPSPATGAGGRGRGVDPGVAPAAPAGWQHLEHGFEPVFDARSRVLVLGSFPSVLSRANAFYYGNPRNRFWPVVCTLTGEDVPAPDDVPARRALLARHGVALWDVVASCDVRGSSDASIRNVVACDLSRVLDSAPVEAIFCNGATAGRLYRRLLGPVCGRPAETLPSTSPANASWSLERLVARWREALRL